MDGTERRDLCTTEVRARTRRIGGESGASVFSAVTGAPERPHHESIFSARAKWRSARGLKADGGSARSGALRWQPRSCDSTMAARSALHACCASKGGAQRVETCWEDGELRASPHGAPLNNSSELRNSAEAYLWNTKSRRVWMRVHTSLESVSSSV